MDRAFLIVALFKNNSWAVLKLQRNKTALLIPIYSCLARQVQGNMVSIFPLWFPDCRLTSVLTNNQNTNGDSVYGKT